MTSMSSTSDHYDKVYSENKVTFGTGKPDRIVEEILKYRTSGSVLELGAGEGRNALFLAGKGFEVTALDVSAVGVEKINTQAKSLGLTLNTEVGDALSYQWPKNFDVIVSTFMMHHLSRADALTLIGQIKENTTAGGLHALSLFTKEGDFFTQNPETPRFYPALGELKEIYNDWEILEYREYQSSAFAKRPDGSPMQNIAASLLARKPAK